jgi:ribonuclease BN (tRNA processing enzyme)
MKIEYICHSALLIETKDITILTDPWLVGSAYCDQWHLFPTPVNVDIAQKADVILISHGHEDHLHHESLLMLNKDAQVYYPFQWQQGIQEYLKSLGYSAITEALSFQAYKLSESTTVTFIANSLDSIMVIESDGETLVNINDALPANHKNIIKTFIQKIKEQWPVIDYLFCGYGSAAYFPNTIHCEGKNDVEIATVREQLFADNFCYIVDALRPNFTVPFAADYVLLNTEKRWINRVKFSKHQIKKYYFNVYKGRMTNFVIAYSGDVISAFVCTRKSAFHDLEKDFSLDELIDDQLEEAIRRVNTINYLSDNKIHLLEKMLRINVRKRSLLFSKELLASIKYTIVISDILLDRYFFVDCSQAEVVVIRTNEIRADSILTLETTSNILNYSFASEWGGDAIVIGYGAEITILDKQILAKSLDIVCVRLLTNQPIASKQMKAAPLRAAKYLYHNPLFTSWAVRQALAGVNKVNKNPVNERSLWLQKTKCEICQVCDLPLLSHEFGETMNEESGSL